jgi:phosphatidylserine/phosphatidylglycerophosphate/cardiolipin synthase-like enzyme
VGPPDGFPWRAGNRFTLLVDGATFYPAMLRAILDARRSVLFEMYLFESGQVAEQFIAAMTAAARRGVTVRLLLDGYGALALTRHDRRRLTEAGVDLVFYNPLRFTRWLRNLVRDHRKLLVVDGRLAFVGGLGITDDFAPPRQGLPTTGGPWRETTVAIEGPVVADWVMLFAQLWQRVRQEVLMLPVATQTVGDQRGRVSVAVAPGRQEIQRHLLAAIREAQERVWIASAYFVPTWRLRRALRRAARRGVDVRLLLAGPYTDHPAVRHAGRRYFQRLLRAGVRIFEYQPRVLHAKTLLVDDWVSIGSSNLDRWNIRWNLEANQEIDDAAFAAMVRAMFERDFSESNELSVADWPARPVRQRLAERFWGGMDRMLDRLGQMRRQR